MCAEIILERVQNADNIIVNKKQNNLQNILKFYTKIIGKAGLLKTY